MKKNKPRIIFWDLETLADLPKVMKYLPGMSAYPGLTMKATHNSVICFGYKVLGEKSPQCLNAWDYRGWKKDVNNDKELVEAARDILITADGIVTHNGTRFDIKFLNSRLVYHGLAPLPKIPHIDTCSVAKSKLFLFNNRLNTLAEFLGVETKMENGGWPLWEKVLTRDPKSMKIMTAYCKQDVNVLEQAYLRLLPMMGNVPNYNLFSGTKEIVCPNCGGTHAHKHGTRTMPNRIVQRYICTNCGTTYSRTSLLTLPKANQ